MITKPLNLAHIEPWSVLIGSAFGRPAEGIAASLIALHGAFPVLAWGVWDRDELIAQYSCLLRRLQVPELGRTVDVGYSFNLAVHPDHRGRGLVKLASEPVYRAVQEEGALAGVGFSNAQGLRVDRRSRGYGYRVVGRLPGRLTLLLKRPAAEALPLMDRGAPVELHEPPPDRLARFADRLELLQHRLGQEEARGIHLSGWKAGAALRGAITHRWFRKGGLRGASLLSADGENLDELIRRWAAAVWDGGGRLIHVVASPAAPVRRALAGLGPGADPPVSRSPYDLTVKPLAGHFPPSLPDHQLTGRVPGRADRRASGAAARGRHPGRRRARHRRAGNRRSA